MRLLTLRLGKWCVPALLLVQSGAFAGGSKASYEVVFPALDMDRLAAEDTARYLKEEPQRFAVGRDLSAVPGREGGWEDQANGRSVWRLQVKTPDAVHLNFGFTRFHLPPSGRLLVTSNEGKLGPYEFKDNPVTGQLWTPVLVGHAALIELDVATAEKAQVEVELTRIGQGYRGFGFRSKHCKSGTCNTDVACLASDDPWNENRRSVAAITVGGTDTCTGSLVNNTNNDRRLLFATAAHCSISSSNVASVLAIFNYESPTCRTPGSAASGVPVARPNSTLAGQTWLASTSSPFSGSAPAGERSDWTLIQLATQANQDSYNLYWSGWDRRAPPTTCAAPSDPASTVGLCASIHHPNVDEKRITFVQDDMIVDNISSASGVHWRANWDPTPPLLPNIAGSPTSLPPSVTEPGSSGSPLYNASHRLVGVLSGGPSSCGATGASLRDQYGGLFASFNGAASSTPTSRMRDHLDPANTGAEFIDGIGQCTPPPVPANVTATATSPNTISVAWTASTGAERYRVFRGDGACPGSGYQQIAEVTGTSYSDTAVSGSSSYSYRIAAVDDGPPICVSAQSTCSSAQATGICLLAPTFAGLSSAQSANQSACSVNLGWSAAASQCGNGATYNVYRSTSANFTPAPGNRIATALTGTSYADSMVDYNTPYFYRVRSVDSGNSTEDGNTVELSVVPRGPVTTGNLTETFEGANGFDNPGWTHQAVAGTGDWTLTTTRSQTPTHSWTSTSLPTVSDRILVSPEFGALANTTLSFWHTYAFESATSTSCFDAGTLEISVGTGGAWTVVPDAAFTAGGFTGTVSASFNNPIGGKRAWCNGTLGEMTQVSVNLGAYAGQTVKVRWHAGDDSSAVVSGWFVDSVSISNAGTAGVCNAGPSDVLFANGFEGGSAR